MSQTMGCNVKSLGVQAMKVLVLYLSQTGKTEAAAEGIAEAAQKLGHEVDVKSVGKVSQADVDGADLLFIGTWVQGLILFGVKPAKADLWVPNLPSLDGKPVGVFCTYAFNPRGSLDKLSDMLRGRGANPVTQQAFHRNKLTEGADYFVNRTIKALEAATV